MLKINDTFEKNEKNMLKQKVFGLGFHKTGTSTLASALYMLGYKVCGQQNALHQELINGNIAPFIDLAQNYDAFEDDPWHLLGQVKKLGRRKLYFYTEIRKNDFLYNVSSSVGTIFW